MSVCCAMLYPPVPFFCRALVCQGDPWGVLLVQFIWGPTDLAHRWLGAAAMVSRRGGGGRGMSTRRFGWLAPGGVEGQGKSMGDGACCCCCSCCCSMCPTAASHNLCTAVQERDDSGGLAAVPLQQGPPQLGRYGNPRCRSHIHGLAMYQGCQRPPRPCHCPCHLQPFPKAAYLGGCSSGCAAHQVQPKHCPLPTAR